MRKLIERLRNFFRTEPYAKDALPDLKYLAKKCIGWLLACEVALVAQIYPQKWFMDSVAYHRTSLRLIGLPMLMLIVWWLGSKMHTIMDNWRNSFNHRLFAMWFSAGYRKQLELSEAWHVKHGTGEKEALIPKNINRIENVSHYLFFQALPISFRVLITSLAMIFIGWQFALLALVTFGCYLLIGGWNSKALKRMANEYRSEQKDLEEYGSQLTENWQPIRSFGQEKYFSSQNEEKLIKFWQGEIPRHRDWRNHLVRGTYLVIISKTCLYLMLGYEVFYNFNPYSIGLVALAGAWMDRVYSNYYNLDDSIHYVHRGYQSLLELLDVFETVADVAQPENPKWPEKVEGAIEFRNVCFSYPESRGEALKNINLKIPPRTVMAIIGPSGGGKSTLARTIELSYHPSSGAVLCDGLDLRQIDQHRYRNEVIGAVGQHPQLLNESIASNIRLGKLDATDAEVETASRMAHAHEFISQIPGGYNAIVGDNGITLSGGQKQRVTIARALVRQPKILILDEATSSLDCESQLLVQQAIDERIEDRSSTTIIIAHRFSTIMKADVVVVMEAGQIVEMGTHAELARQNGVYARFRKYETEGFLV